MSEVTQRIDMVRRQLPELDIEALVITQEANRRYVTDFTGSAGVVVLTPTEARLLIDFRYQEQAEKQAQAYTLAKVPSRYQDSMAEVLTELGVTRVGFEAEHLSVAELARWTELLPSVTWVSTSGVVEAGRAVKSASELAAIRRAAALADAAMAHVQATVRPGQTEAEVAWSVEKFMRDAGADGLAFATIVGAGENGALPHHSPGGRQIQAGEPIVVDLGARLDGYHSDLTRTFCIGPAQDPDYQRVYDIVAAANLTAAKGIKAGMTGMAADSLARELIKAEGFGENFGHGLGHGVGLNIHEGPRLSFVPPEVELEVGNVVTIEPGIYLPGRFGVRTEDLAVIGPDGVEVLSHAAKTPFLELA
jgi:Xaa-Pro aminopeptidase